MDADEVFDSGNMNAAVARIGDRVLRHAGLQTPTVHRLLAHVRAQGVNWVPAPHGVDEHGREVLDFVPGEVPDEAPDGRWSERVLTDVARALRQWHDAASSFEHRPDDVWWRDPITPVETVCHGDFAPYNHVFRSGTWVGAIDFDVCTPAPRLWDLAYTAYRYVPLIPHLDDAVDDGPGADRSPLGLHEREDRLALLCEAYGPVDGEAVEPHEVAAWAARRLRDLAAWTAHQTFAAAPAHAAMYRAHAGWIEQGMPGR